MSGHLYGNTRWGREGVAAIAAETRAAIEEAIPDGHSISVGASASKGDWTLALRNGHPVSVAVVYHQHSIEGGCAALLQLAEKVA